MIWESLHGFVGDEDGNLIKCTILDVHDSIFKDHLLEGAVIIFKEAFFCEGIFIV